MITREDKVFILEKGEKPPQDTLCIFTLRYNNLRRRIVGKYNREKDSIKIDSTQRSISIERVIAYQFVLNEKGKIIKTNKPWKKKTLKS